MRITKRIVALLLTLAMFAGWLPAIGATDAQAQEIAAVQQETAEAAAKTTGVPSRQALAERLALRSQEQTELPQKTEKASEPSEQAYAEVDALFDQIDASESQPAMKNGSQSQKTEAAMEIVMQSDSYVEGSLEQNGNVFTWWTDTGIRCIYNPYMQDQAKGFAEKGEDIVYNEPAATKSDMPTGSQVYLVGPYYGYDSDFTEQYKNEAKRIATAIGDTDGYTLYGGSAATVDTVAKAVSNGAVVIFDSHGSTDYQNPYDEEDYYSGANYSYLCLKSASGLTDQDYYDGAAYGGSTTYINGAAIANHMTKNSPSGIVWMAICLGMATDTLQAPLRSKGVEVVYGYSQSVSFIGDYVFEYAFWTEMCQGKTVADSIATMKSKFGEWDYTPQILSYYGYSGGHSTVTQARAAYDAFPIVVSDEDPYPGRHTSSSYGVDAPQTVYSTYHLAAQSGGSSSTISGNCGYYGDNLTWTLDGSGILTISGDGYMVDYQAPENVPWYGYRMRIQSVVVEEGVWEIGDRAFFECLNLTSVSLPSTLTLAIGNYAFYGCENLTAVTIPQNVKGIGEGSFCLCSSLTSVSIPAKTTIIGNDAFAGCYALKSLILSEGVQEIGERAFGWCYELTSVVIPATVTSIGSMPFLSCTALNSITVRSGNSYYSNDSKGVLFDKNKTVLLQAPGAISGTYTMPSTVTTIESGTFCECDYLTEVKIPASVTSIDNYAFESCDALTAIRVDSGNSYFTNDAAGALYNKSKTCLMQVPGATTGRFVVLSGVQEITYGAFYDCYRMTSVVIPKTVTVICNYAFDECRGLTDVYYEGSQTQWQAIDIYANNAYLKGANIHYNYISDVAPVSILSHPNNVTAEDGQTVFFSVIASDTVVSYQWQYSSDNGSSWYNSSSSTQGYNASTLAVEATLARNGFLYRCKVTDAAGNEAVSNAAKLTVTARSFSITSQPQSVTAKAGETVKFTVETSHQGATYQWQYRQSSSHTWTACTGTGYNTKTLTVTAPSQSGYQYRCRVSYNGVIYTSQVATLTVSANPIQITTQPKNQSVTEGKSAVFTIAATGNNLSYQWQYSTDDGASWYNCSSGTQGYNASTLIVEGTLARNGFLYRCKVTDGNGNSCYSNAASLTVQKQPFAFLQHPQNVTAQPGDTVSFSVKTNYADVTYRWVFQTKEDTTWMYWSTSNDPSQISCYVYESMDGYRFRCIATYNGTAYWSNTAVLTVASPSVQITSQPKDQSVTEGENAVFSVVATGNNLSYQWQYSTDGGASWNNSSSATAGYNTAKLTVAATLARNGFQYRCKVTDGSGNVCYSNAALLTVKEAALLITSQPSAATVVEGQNAIFSVSASGNDLSYLWQYSKDSGASWYSCSSSTQGYNTATLSVEGTLVRNGFQYRCKVTDGSGKYCFSNAASLTVEKHPIQFTAQPKDQTVSEGKQAVFTVVATGKSLSYQWQYSSNGGSSWNNSSSSTAGYNTASLTVVAALTRDGFLYRCKLTDCSGNVRYSDAAALTVKAQPVQITQQPKSVTVTEGEKAVFSVKAEGADLQYQWQYSKDGGNLWNNSSSSFPGYNTATLTVEGTLARNGFLYRCKVTGSATTLYSQAATLTVKAYPIQITAQPSNKSITEGSNAVFSVAATGTDLTYQWQYSKDSGASWYGCSSSFSGYNTPKLTVEGTLARNGFLYRCKLTDGSGNVLYSKGATLTVKEHPIQITSQPVSKTVTEDANAVFSVTATGEGLSYRWQYMQPGSTVWTASSSATAGYNTATLTVVGTLARNGFQYRCQIKDANGNSCYTNAVTLTVKEKPIRITSQPVSKTVEEGENAVFSVTATGEGLSYRWQYKQPGSTAWTASSSATAGYNTATLTVVGTYARNGFQYRCQIKDAAGNVCYSEAATLNVLEAAIKITGQPKNATVEEDANARFTVEATGEKLTYMWQYKKTASSNWTNCTAATAGYNTATLTVVGTLARNGFQYRCRIVDNAGNIAYSDSAVLTVNKRTLGFTQQPESAVAKLGNYAEFAVAAEGTDLTYRWQYSTNGTSWINTTVFTSGYNTATLRVLAEEKRDGFRYRCCVTDGKGNKIYSKAATLTVDLPAQSVFVSQPTDQYRMAGRKAYFEVKLQGSIASIQWQYQTAPGTAWYDSSSATLGYNTAKLTVNGDDKRNGFAYRCVVTDTLGYIHVSEAATLTITKAQINSNPTDATVSAGTEQVFRVTVTGAYSQVYWQYSKDGGKSWYASSSSFPGYNTNAMTVTATAGRNGFLYRCVLVDIDGTKIYSTPALLTVK